MNRKETKTKDKTKNPDANRDPLTGAPGAHPVGTGVGAAGGGAAGAAIGALGGPVGAGIGLAAGAIAGGLAGKGVAETVNPTVEDAYWREHYTAQSFIEPNRPYEDYQPGFRTGYEGYSRYGVSGQSYDEVEADLQRDYERNRGTSKLAWDQARHAARAAWSRLDRNLGRLIDYDVVDRNGNHVGMVDCFWTDTSGQPAFLGVKTGWLFGKNHVVPASKAEISERTRKIRLPYSEEMIKGAPSFDPDIELEQSKEDEIYRYYRIEKTAAPCAAAAPEAMRGQPESREEATMQLKEEQIRVGKREVEAGGVRLRKVIRTEVVNQPVELKREEIVVERVPASEAEAKGGAFEQEEIFIPLRREEAVIRKETHVREEVRVRKKVETQRQTVSESVRKEDVEIDESQKEVESAPRFSTDEMEHARQDDDNSGRSRR